jgi:uncharacterized membrane protein
MPSRPVILRAAISVSYLLLVHVAALLHQPLIGVAAILLVLMSATIANLVRRGWSRSSQYWLLGCALALGLIVAGLSGVRAIAAIILFPPALISAYFFVLFGRTLQPGQEPLITRFSRVNFDGTVPPAIARYTRRLTVVWTLLFGAMTVETAALGAFAELQTWSWWANVINPTVAISFFFLEHGFRALWYREWGRSSPLRTIAIMMRPSSWIDADVEWSSRH